MRLIHFDGLPHGKVINIHSIKQSSLGVDISAPSNSDSGRHRLHIYFCSNYDGDRHRGHICIQPMTRARIFTYFYLCIMPFSRPEPCRSTFPSTIRIQRGRATRFGHHTYHRKAQLYYVFTRFHTSRKARFGPPGATRCR